MLSDVSLGTILHFFIVKVDENEEAEKNEGVGDLFTAMSLLSNKKAMGRSGLRGRGRGRGNMSNQK